MSKSRVSYGFDGGGLNTTNNSHWGNKWGILYQPNNLKLGEE